jgi:hypothetical protein
MIIEGWLPQPPTPTARRENIAAAENSALFIETSQRSDFFPAPKRSAPAAFDTANIAKKASQNWICEGPGPPPGLARKGQHSYGRASDFLAGWAKLAPTRT